MQLLIRSQLLLTSRGTNHKTTSKRMNRNWIFWCTMGLDWKQYKNRKGRWVSSSIYRLSLIFQFRSCKKKYNSKFFRLLPRIRRILRHLFGQRSIPTTRRSEDLLSWVAVHQWRSDPAQDLSFDHSMHQWRIAYRQEWAKAAWLNQLRIKENVSWICRS